MEYALAKAITATAYKLARIIYAMLKHGMAYVAQGLAAYETAYRERVSRQMKRNTISNEYLCILPKGVRRCARVSL